MTPSARDLLREALRLPLEDRADVAAELLASLEDELPDDPQSVEAEWATEILARAERAAAGAETTPWSAVRKQVARRLAQG